MIHFGSFRWAAIAGTGAALFAACIGPIVRAHFWRRAAPPDEYVGVVPFLDDEERAVRVQGKRSLLIGGTRGVGYGTALALAKAGSHVTIVGRSEQSGMKAVKRIQSELSRSKHATGASVEFLQGDLGTVCDALKLVRTLEAKVSDQNRRYDFLIVTAATFPDWSQPLKNVDGVEKSFAIAVVGRFLIYRNMHRFMESKFRVLNVLASGVTSIALPLNREIVSGVRNVKGLMEAVMTFALGNEIMLESLFKHDPNIASRVTMVSTHPGLLKTGMYIPLRRSDIKAL